MCFDGSLTPFSGMDATLRPGGLLLTERGVSSCCLSTGARVLDVGCGPGATVSYLRKYHHLHAIGMDLRVAPAWTSHREGGMPFLVGLAEELPVRRDSLDGIVCECVLSLLHEPHGAVMEFARVLREEGCLIVSDLYDRRVACDTVGAKGAACEGLPGIRTLGETERMISEAGFQVLLLEDHTTCLKEMAAQQLLSGGSLDCCPGLPPGVLSRGDAKLSVMQPRLGYYLLTACRR